MTADSALAASGVASPAARRTPPPVSAAPAATAFRWPAQPVLVLVGREPGLVGELVHELELAADAAERTSPG